MISYIRTKDHLTVVFQSGETATFYPNDKNFKQVVESLSSNDYGKIYNLAFPANNIVTSLNVELGEQNVYITNGVVYYNQQPLHNVLTNRMVEMLNEGFNITPMKNFLINLMNNPSNRAVNELYSFLEVGNLPITADGDFLAYKVVTDNYMDCYSETINNSIGQVVKMDRNNVDDNCNVTCSHGLHFCSREYLTTMGSNRNDRRIMIVKINPRDVVSIPCDYNNTKGRCCEYQVIGELHSGDTLEGLYRNTPYDNNVNDVISDDDVIENSAFTGLDQLNQQDNIDDKTFNDHDVIENSAFTGLDNDTNNDQYIEYNDSDLVALNSNITNGQYDKYVGQFSINNKNIDDIKLVDVFVDVEEASDMTNIPVSHINRVLRRYRKTTRGFVWKYLTLEYRNINGTECFMDEDGHKFTL